MSFSVYQVYYWDPCNGMGGRSELKGTWLDEDAAQAYAKEHNQGAWMQNSHTVRPLEVIGPDLVKEKRNAYIGVGRWADPIHPDNYQDQVRYVSPWVKEEDA